MSNDRTITDTDLVEFRKWYADFHGDTDIETSVIVTCLCGYLHVPQSSRQVADAMQEIAIGCCQRRHLEHPEGGVFFWRGHTLVNLPPTSLERFIPNFGGSLTEM